MERTSQRRDGARRRRETQFPRRLYRKDRKSVFSFLRFGAVLEEEVEAHRVQGRAKSSSTTITHMYEKARVISLLSLSVWSDLFTR